MVPSHLRREPTLAAGAPRATGTAIVPGRRSGAITDDVGFSLAWPTPNLLGMFGAVGSSTGIPVTHVTALQITAVYACVKCLAEDIAKLPVQVQRRRDAGGWAVDYAHPLNALFRAPNVWQTSFDFWTYVGVCLNLRGNAYVVVKRGIYGDPIGLIPVNPDRVAVMLSPKGWLYYNISHPQVGDGITLHHDDVLHFRNVSIDGGYLGISPIAAGQEAIGLATATQQHGAVLFRQGSQIKGFLSAPMPLTPEAAKRIGQDWTETYGGVQNSHKTAVLEGGLDFKSVQMTNEDAQFLATRQFQIPEICRIFRVPPHKIQDLSRATFSNIENQNQQYIDDALLPIATRYEQTAERVLLFDDERGDIRIRFDFNGLLRADRKTRLEANEVGIRSGQLSRNEARETEGLAPYTGGDDFLIALNTGAPPVAGTAPPASDSPPLAEPGAGSEEPDPNGTEAPVSTVVGDGLGA